MSTVKCRELFYDYFSPCSDKKYSYPEELKSQLINIEKASDGWLTYDRQYYTDELFMSLSKDVQEL